MKVPVRAKGSFHHLSSSICVRGCSTSNRRIHCTDKRTHDGTLDLSKAPFATSWPSFPSRGRQRYTVRQTASSNVKHQTPNFKLQTTNYLFPPFPRGPVPGTGLERGSPQTPRSSRLGLAANFEGVSVNTIYIPMLTPFLTPCSCFLLESHFSSCLYCKNSSTKRLYDKIYHYVLFNPTNPLKKFIMLL